MLGPGVNDPVETPVSLLLAFVPWPPGSEEPMAASTVTCGSSSMNSCLCAVESGAPPEAMIARLEVS